MHVKSNDFNLKNNYILLGSFSIKENIELAARKDEPHFFHLTL